MPPYIARVSKGRSLLLVAQLTPPSSIVGARRPGSLAKYLGRRGHRVMLLTSVAGGRGPAEGVDRVVRTRDLLASGFNWRRHNLAALQEVDQGTYEEASRLERVIVPDLSAVGWLPFALPRALAIARRTRFDAVITTSPPPSAHLIGLALRRTGVPWVADLRDGWTFDPPRPPWPTALQDRVDTALERLALSHADRLVAVTHPIAEDLERRFDRPVATITNGFDPEDRAVRDGAALLDPTKHSLVYTGRLSLVDRSPRQLGDGLLEFLRRWPDEAARTEVVLAGPVSAEQQELLADPRLAGLARSIGNLDRSEALGLQRAADSLLLIAEGSSFRPARSVATGKLFEYLATSHPILVLGEDSAAARIVRETGAGLVAPAGDSVAVAEAVHRISSGDQPAPANVQRFEWPALAEHFEREIQAACEPVN
jgi:glycosyltransferase involved in cell wall biosynthesis